MTSLKTYSRFDNKPLPKAERLWDDFFNIKRPNKISVFLSNSTDSQIASTTTLVENTIISGDDSVVSPVRKVTPKAKRKPKKKTQRVIKKAQPEKVNEKISDIEKNFNDVDNFSLLVEVKPKKQPKYFHRVTLSPVDQQVTHAPPSPDVALSSDSNENTVVDVEVESSHRGAPSNLLLESIQDIRAGPVPTRFTRNTRANSLKKMLLENQNLSVSSFPDSPIFRAQCSTPLTVQSKNFSPPFSSIKGQPNKENIASNKTGKSQQIYSSSSLTLTPGRSNESGLNSFVKQPLFKHSNNSNDSSHHSVRLNLDASLRVIVYDLKGIHSAPRGSLNDLHQISSLLEHFEINKSHLTPKEKVLKFCNQEDYISFAEMYDWKNVKQCKKIGEGSFGEVYSFIFNRKLKVLKVVPIKSTNLAEDSFAAVLSEMIISKVLGDLRNSSYNMTSNFVKFVGAKCVSGYLPEPLCLAGDDYAANCSCDQPFDYSEHHVFLILEYGHAGSPLDTFELRNPKESQSVINQVVCALAIAEESCMFEHRDLHSSNVLLSRTRLKHIQYIHKGKKFQFPTHGVQVTIIDFTLSRLSDDQGLIFSDLKKDSSIFKGEGDYQFDIYRLTRQHNGNDWSKFDPYSNVLWLHYLLTLLCSSTFKNSEAKSHVEAKKMLCVLKKNILSNESALQLMENLDVYNF